MNTIDYNNIPKNIKKRFLEIILYLFSEYKSVTLTDKGVLIFRTGKLFRRNVKIDLVNFILLHVLNELSILRYNNNDLVPEYLHAIGEGITSCPSNRITYMLNYVIYEFNSIKFRDLNYNVGQKTCLSNNGITLELSPISTCTQENDIEDVEAVIDEFVKEIPVKDKNTYFLRINPQITLTRVRRAVASILLVLLLNIGIFSDMLIDNLRPVIHNLAAIYIISKPAFINST